MLGCADIARRRVLPAMAAHRQIDLVAVASRDPARAVDTARAFGGRPVHGYQALLAHDDLDAVYVPLPVALHAEWTEAALRSGRHVLVEKPVTDDPDRAAELLALADELGLVLAENVMFVHHRQHHAVSRMLDEGTVGEVRAVHATFSIPARAADDIRYRPELGGGALWDVGLYPVRLAQHLLGADLRVAGVVVGTAPEHRVDTSGAALLHTADGVAAQVNWGIGQAYRSAYEITGTTGRLSVDRAFTPPAGHAPVIRVERGNGVEDVRLEPDDQVAAALTAFVAAVRHPSTADGGPMLEQIRLLDRIQRKGTVCTRS